MQEKSEASSLVVNFHVFVKNKFGRTIKIIRSNNGFTFSFGPMERFYLVQGILHQTSYVDIA